MPGPRVSVDVWLLRNRLSAVIVNWIGLRRAQRITSWLELVLPAGGAVLDVGSGLGHIAQVIRRDRTVVTVDPWWQPMCEGPHVVASAEALPFEDNAFDVVLLAFVLHHMEANLHRRALAEAARVARVRVVLIEDTFRCNTGRRYTHAVDSLLNAEFFGHPHSNRRSGDWCNELIAVGLDSRVIWERSERWLSVLPIRHALLVGETRNPTNARNGPEV